MIRFPVLAAVALIVPIQARAQSFNLNIGPAAAQPSSTYGAAGIPGHWITIPAYHNTTTYDLRDINNVTTPVRVGQYGGTELRSTNDPGTTGDDALLMDDCQVTYTQNLETCLFFYDLQNGEYEVLIYAMMPGQPSVLSYTSSDEEPGYPHYIIGGAWPGFHREGVTFSRHRCNVGPPQGLLRTHSGIVPGQNSAMGSAFNGIQIRKLPPKLAGDMDCNLSIDAKDIAGFIHAMTSPNTYYATAPACRIDNADVNNDGRFNMDDVTAFVNILLL